MTESFVIDVVAVIIVILAMWGGWRQGAIASVFSVVGVIAGLLIGIGVAPLTSKLTDSVVLRLLLTIGIIILLVALGNLIGGAVGATLRRRVHSKGLRITDSLIGSVFQGIVTLLVVWLISVPIATGFGGPVASVIQNSRILGTIDRYAPDSVQNLPARIAALFNESGLPPLVSPFVEGRVPEVEAPRINVADTQLVEAVRPSVIHVMGDATSCSRRLMGSGFVAAPDYVVTNAHVVAGTDTVRLDTTLGVKDADVVYYNPELDIAVLHSPGLELPVLPWAEEPAQSGQDAIVMGFPESGPFEAAPARVQAQIPIQGPNIYADGRVERDVYTVRGTIREGNSGGPLLDEHGQVLGVVFGASIDRSDIGFVLTAPEVRDAIGDLAQLTDPVDTRTCIAR